MSKTADYSIVSLLCCLNVSGMSVNGIEEMSDISIEDGMELRINPLAPTATEQHNSEIADPKDLLKQQGNLRPECSIAGKV